MKTVCSDLLQLREQQYAKVAWTACEEIVLERIRGNASARNIFAGILPDIKAGRIGPRRAARIVVDALLLPPD